MNNGSGSASPPLFAERFTGRTVLVTGASGGLGSQIAIAFAASGASVALQYNKTAPVKAQETIQGLDTRHRSVQSELNQPGAAPLLLDEIDSHLGIPDILVNCAASQDVSDIDNISEQDFDQMMRTNVSALFNLSTEFVRRNESDAVIINISSIEAARPATGHAHYAISKSAVEMLTKSLALEYGPKGIRTNTIAPGLVERQGIHQDWPQGVESWEKNCPLGRMAKPQDIANACLFLASEEGGFINGATLTIDGGMTVTPGW